MGLNEIKKIIQENNIDTVEIGFADIPGVLRGKRIPVRQFLRNVDKGFSLAKAVFAWDIQCAVFPGTRLASFKNGYPDLIARPILSTFKKVPWREGSAFVLCDLYDEHGGGVEVSPREILKKVVEKANELGYRPLIGAELEFYLLDGERKPLYEGIQCYSLYKGSELEFILKEIRVSLEEFGIHVEASNTEYGPAQVEINLEYDDALTMADKTLLFKNAVKEIARKHGLYATFMAKPWAEESGNGFHVHQSLWNQDKTINYFDKDKKLAENYLAGLLSTARSFMAFASPSINSYKRYRDHSFAPINVTWGFDNRTVTTRSLLGTGNASRLEHRTGSADANPYLIIAANIIAGLYGIEEKLVPPPITDDNAYLVDAPLLPKTLVEALNLLENDEVSKNYFDEQFLELFLVIGYHETSEFESAVTDWERARYLEMA